jgi:hypothetical protein
MNGAYGQSLPSTLGDWRAIYIEDSAFELTGASGNHVIFDVAYGNGRYVFRNNTTKGMGFYLHESGNGNEVTGARIEIYENKIEAVEGIWNSYPARFESGHGIIANNQVIGFTDNYWKVNENRILGSEGAPMGACDGNGSYDGNAGDVSAPGWPCYGQIGRGFGPVGSQPSVPMQAWRNGSEATCRTGGTCTDATVIGLYNYPETEGPYIKTTAHTVTGGGYGQGDKDFCNGGSSQTLPCGTYNTAFTKWTHPYPKDANGMPTNTGSAATPALSGATISGGKVIQ